MQRSGTVHQWCKVCPPGRFRASPDQPSPKPQDNFAWHPGGGSFALIAAARLRPLRTVYQPEYRHGPAVRSRPPGPPHRQPRGRPATGLDRRRKRAPVLGIRPRSAGRGRLPRPHSRWRCPPVGALVRRAGGVSAERRDLRGGAGPRWPNRLPGQRDQSHELQPRAHRDSGFAGPRPKRWNRGPAPALPPRHGAGELGRPAPLGRGRPSRLPGSDLQGPPAVPIRLRSTRHHRDESRGRAARPRLRRAGGPPRHRPGHRAGHHRRWGRGPLHSRRRQPDLPPEPGLG